MGQLKYFLYVKPLLIMYTTFFFLFFSIIFSFYFFSLYVYSLMHKYSHSNCRWSEEEREGGIDKTPVLTFAIKGL